jgi:hypothetical protein
VHEQHSVDIDEDECVVALVEDNNSDDEEDWSGKWYDDGGSNSWHRRQNVSKPKTDLIGTPSSVMHNCPDSLVQGKRSHSWAQHAASHSHDQNKLGGSVCNKVSLLNKVTFYFWI